MAKVVIKSCLYFMFVHFDCTEFTGSLSVRELIGSDICGFELSLASDT